MAKILIIDDDVSIGNMIETALLKAGHEAWRAYSGTEALLLLEKEQPELILLDLMLPGLSGEELLPKIREIPVIVVSAKVGIDDKVNMLLGGAVDYLTKPFELKELLARVFGNILSNVLKYSDDDLKVELKENGDLTFSNHARDLDEVQVGKLFDRFFTAETARGSTGLGLSIARTLMEQMGGKITAGYEDGILKIRILAG